MYHDRRRFLTTLAASGAATLAGCVDSATDGDGGDRTATESGEDGPPTAASRRHIGHSLERLRRGVAGSGVPKDGIPSIDNPVFAAASEFSMADDSPVFGVAHGGEQKAYPQFVLVHHEIVNDTVGGDPLAVTYCPLTGTAEAFHRGGTEFGVSGDLVNANLVMYDRGTDTRWPQVLATGIRGPLSDESLREVRVVWTTWGEWRAAYPDTRVLTDNTGYARRYGADPYGDYAPRKGYYENDQYLFSPLVEDDRAHPKRVVLGARTGEEAVAFDKQRLLADRVLTAERESASFVAVADESLSTGYVYRNPEDVSVTAEGDAYAVDGETYTPDKLPLPDVLAFDAMWFAWAGFYPGATYVQ
jgi:hypothetical protein